MRIYAGDEEVLALWRRFRALSIKAYEQVYKRLNVYFDVYSGESQVTSEGIARVMRTLKEKGLLTTKTLAESQQYHGAQSDAVDDEMDALVAQAGDNNDSPQGAKPQAIDGVDANENEMAKDTGPSLALAVDLSEWKLGKPVVEKGGQ